VWAAAFGLKRVGPEQDFFLDLGGHSLLAAQTVAKLRDRADLHVPVRDIYSFPTVRKLAHHLESRKGEQPGRRRGAGRCTGLLRAPGPERSSAFPQVPCYSA